MPWLARSLVLAGALSLPLLAAGCDDDPDSELERQADSAGEELQEAFVRIDQEKELIDATESASGIK